MQERVFTLLATIMFVCVSLSNANPVPEKLKKQLPPWEVIVQRHIDGEDYDLESIKGEWKKDLFAFCRELKGEIESNPDPQLINSSIAVSHFDKVMEIAAFSDSFTSELMCALVDAMKNREKFFAGLCPDLVIGKGKIIDDQASSAGGIVIGLNKIKLRRFPGSPITYFVVFVPSEYDKSKKWPVTIYPSPRHHEARNNYFYRYRDYSGMIRVWWEYSTNAEYQWKDYKTFLELLNKKIEIDENRIYIEGQCGNAPVSMDLALHYPDHWAECSFSMGSSHHYLAANTTNVPVIYVKGIHNEPLLVASYRFASKCFEYFYGPLFQKSIEPGFEETWENRLSVAKKIKNPKTIKFTMDSLHASQSYWLKVNSRIDENFLGKIQADAEGQTISIKTYNIDGYTLDLINAPVDQNTPIRIVENNIYLASTKDHVFTKTSQRHEFAKYIKSSYLQGPIWDVFTDPFVVVWGTGGDDRELIQAGKTLARSLSGMAPCFSDVNLPENLIDTHHLVLVGTAQSNTLIAKLFHDLPLQLGNNIKANGVVYEEKDTGFMFIHPNPLNLNKYLAAFSATSPKALNAVDDALKQARQLREADIGIFQLDSQENIKWLVLEKFDSTWNWHEDWDTVLTSATKIFSTLHWQQLLARAARQGLKADVAILDDPFLFDNVKLQGQISFRKLYNTFKNDWIVKVKIKGGILRRILTNSFEHAQVSRILQLVVEGVHLSQAHPKDLSEAIGLHEIKSEQTYSLACPSRFISGNKFGFIIEDYELVGQEFLIPLLKKYLSDLNGKVIDNELTKTTPVCF